MIVIPVCYFRRTDRHLIRAFRRGDGRAREAMIERHLPLARSLALRYRVPPDATDDLVQVASLGLIKAVDRWDPERGVSFTTFAVPTIQGELRRYFRDATWLVRPPRELLELALTVGRARDAMDGEPTVAALAERLGRPPGAIADALAAGAARRAVSLDRPLSDDDSDTRTVSDALGGEDEGFAQVEARLTLDRLMAQLDQREREILRLRFHDGLVQREIAERFGTTQVHVSRLIRASLTQLRSTAAPV